MFDKHFTSNHHSSNCLTTQTGSIYSFLMMTGSHGFGSNNYNFFIILILISYLALIINLLTPYAKGNWLVFFTSQLLYLLFQVLFHSLLGVLSSTFPLGTLHYHLISSYCLGLYLLPFCLPFNVILLYGSPICFIHYFLFGLDFSLFTTRSFTIT